MSGFILFLKCFAHNGNEHVQQMDLEGEGGHVPENGQGCITTSISNSIHVVLEVSQGNPEHVGESIKCGGVIWVVNIIFWYIVKVFLISSQQLERARECKDDNY